MLPVSPRQLGEQVRTWMVKQYGNGTDSELESGLLPRSVGRYVDYDFTRIIFASIVERVAKETHRQYKCVIR